MLYSIITILVLLIGGVLASMSLIIDKAPDSKEQLSKLVPLKWIIGVILFFMWLFDFFTLWWAASWGLFLWLMALVSLLTKIVLGLLLSSELVAKYILHIDLATKKTKRKKKVVEWDEWKEQATNFYSLLGKAQVPFGIAAILVAILAFFVLLYFLIF